MVAVLLLLAGVLLELVALAVLAGRTEVAASRPLRRRSRAYGVGAALAGAVLLAAAVLSARLS